MLARSLAESPHVGGQDYAEGEEVLDNYGGAWVHIGRDFLIAWQELGDSWIHACREAPGFAGMAMNLSFRQSFLGAVMPLSAAQP